jgi:chromosome partitioning protein
MRQTYHMRILVLHTPKGGSGKSTMARELAVAASATLKTALADLDPQGTTTGWYQRREAKAPALVNLDPSKSWAHLVDAGVELLVVDTPPGQPAYIAKLLASADAVLVPVRPTPDDLLAAAPIATNLGRHPAWAFVLSQVPPRTRMLAGALRQLAALGRVAPVQFTFRADYPAAAISGQAATEFTGKAADEAAALWLYVQTILRGSDAPTPEGKPGRPDRAQGNRARAS